LEGVLLSVREIEEYFFCPLLFYYRNYLGIDTQEGFWAYLGKRAQEEAEEEIRKRFEILGKEVELRSDRLGVVGKVDFIVGRGREIMPLEVKFSGRLRPWWKYSISLYAMLLEDSIGRPVKSGVVLVTRGMRFIEVRVGDSERRFVIGAIEKCRRIMEGEIPRAYRSRSCENCDFKNRCLEV
jgi:CRISPR-associated exonuclease Cas4